MCFVCLALMSVFSVIDLGDGTCSCDEECSGTNVVCNEGICECEPGFLANVDTATCEAGEICNTFPT